MYKQIISGESGLQARYEAQNRGTRVVDLAWESTVEIFFPAASKFSGQTRAVRRTKLFGLPTQKTSSYWEQNSEEGLTPS